MGKQMVGRMGGGKRAGLQFDSARRTRHFASPESLHEWLRKASHLSFGTKPGGGRMRLGRGVDRREQGM
jgi:hypothetical protein